MFALLLLSLLIAAAGVPTITRGQSAGLAALLFGLFNAVVAVVALVRTR